VVLVIIRQLMYVRYLKTEEKNPSFSGFYCLLLLREFLNATYWKQKGHSGKVLPYACSAFKIFPRTLDSFSCML